MVLLDVVVLLLDVVVVLLDEVIDCGGSICHCAVQFSGLTCPMVWHFANILGPHQGGNTALHFITALHCTALHCTSLHSTTLHYTTVSSSMHCWF